jgi:hypothetical protein
MDENSKDVQEYIDNVVESIEKELDSFTVVDTENGKLLAQRFQEFLEKIAPLTLECSAGELRAIGFNIPEHIPDCAVAKEHLKVGPVTPDTDSDTEDYMFRGTLVFEPVS